MVLTVGLFAILIAVGLYLDRLDALQALMWVAAFLVLCAVIRSAGGEWYVYMGLTGVLDIVLAICVADNIRVPWYWGR